MRKNRVIECVLYRDASLLQVVATWNRLKTEEERGLAFARLARVTMGCEPACAADTRTPPEATPYLK